MKVLLSRPKQIMDTGRPYVFRTESEELATIKAGDQVEVEIPDSAEFVYANLAYFNSNPLPVEELSDNDQLLVKNSCDGWKLLVPLLPLFYILNKQRYLNLSVQNV